MKRYPAEQIFYEMDCVTCCDNDILSNIVAKALSKVPPKVVDEVLNHCNIVTPVASGTYISKEYISGAYFKHNLG